MRSATCSPPPRDRRRSRRPDARNPAAPMFGHVVHCDWSIRAAGRWSAEAHRAPGGGWRASGPLECAPACRPGRAPRRARRRWPDPGRLRLPHRLPGGLRGRDRLRRLRLGHRCDRPRRLAGNLRRRGGPRRGRPAPPFYPARPGRHAPRPPARRARRRRAGRPRARLRAPRAGGRGRRLHVLDHGGAAGRQGRRCTAGGRWSGRRGGAARCSGPSKAISPRSPGGAASSSPNPTRGTATGNSASRSGRRETAR